MAPPSPLSGLRVVDLTTGVMGPYTTQILADYGADVIKVEPPGGDVMRKAGPMRSPGMGPVHLHLNRNKRSIVLDAKKESGRAVLLRLCARADVLVHHVRPAAMRRLALAADDVRAVNPRIVYATLLGYGDDGPYAGRPAYDDLIQGACGLPALFTRAGGEEPRYVPLTLADRIVGITAAHAILAALLARDRTGRGQSIEIPMFETLAQFVLGDHMAGRTFDPPLGPAGYSRLLSPDRRPYPTLDGHLCVLLYNDKHWESFFRALGRLDEFHADARFHDLGTRARHYDEVYAWLADVLKTRTTAAWIELLEANDIPCVRLRGVDAVVDDPHLRAVGFFQEVDDPAGGKLRLTGVPSRWNGSHLHLTRSAPRLGEHSVEILREAGLSPDEITRLLEEGVTEDGARPDGRGRPG